jgi:hypothetical protein
MYRSGSLLLACSILVSPSAFADTVESPAPAPASISTASVSLALPTLLQLDPKSWQEEYDAARSKKNRGRALMLIGAAVTGLGVAMIATKTGVIEDCDILFCTVNYQIPAVVLSSGGGLLVWGVIQQRDASGTIRTLEGQRPRQTSAQIAIPVARGTSVAVGSGAVALRHAVSW